jgi:hypothetical protein
MQAAFHRRVPKIKSVQSPVGLDMPQMGQFWLKSDTVLSTMFRNRVGGRRLTLFTGSVVSRSTRVALLTGDGWAATWRAQTTFRLCDCYTSRNEIEFTHSVGSWCADSDRLSRRRTRPSGGESAHSECQLPLM